MFLFKMAAKKKCSFRKNNHVTKIWKITFPMEFFNKIWLKVQENEYIYIFICLKMAAETSFVMFSDVAQCKCLFMLISMKMAQPISFFSKMRNQY